MTLKTETKKNPSPDRSLLRQPVRRVGADPDPADQNYVLELTLRDAAGLPLAGVELSVVNNNTGLVSSRYSDGNGYTNHGVLGRAGDLCTYQSNGAIIVAATDAPPEGPQYRYLPTAPRVVADLSLGAA